MPSQAYSDEKIEPGLIERTLASGEVVYRSFVYFDGKQHLETFAGVNRTEAKRLHRARRTAIDNGERPARRDLTLGELREEAFAHFQALIDRGKANGKPPRIRQGSLDNYKTAWTLRVSPYTHGGKSIDRLRLDTIDRKLARAWLAWLAETGVAPSTQNGTLTAMRSVLRYARDNDYMEVDPFSAVPTEERPSQSPRDEWEAHVFSNAELARVREAILTNDFIEATPGVLLTNVVLMLIDTGMRLSETAGARWQHVDLFSKLVNVREQRERHKAAEDAATTDPKTRRSVRSIPMTAKLYDALMAQHKHEQSKDRGKPGDFLFTDETGEPITIERIKDAVRRATRLAGLGEHGPQVLRRSFATQVAHARISSIEAEAMLGHSAKVFEDNYAKPLREAEQMAENMGKLAAIGFGR